MALGKSAEKKQKKGPPLEKAFHKDGTLTSLGQGFFTSIGHPNLKLSDIQEENSSIKIQMVKEIQYLFVTQNIEAVSTYEILSKGLPHLILNLDFPKKMFWSDLKIPFPRPLRSLLAIHGSRSLDFQIGPIQSSNMTRGHPLLSSQQINISTAQDYFDVLEKHHVIVDPIKRKKMILNEIQILEKKHSLQVKEVTKVLNDVLYLSEYPKLLLGTFDSKYLNLPKDLISLVLVFHQRYFPTEDQSNKLINHFVVCLDNKPSIQMKKGHEKAISPRLADGLFLYHQDLKLGLKHFTKQLTTITFQENLGNMDQKAKRLIKHALVLNRSLSFSTDELEEAAILSKADLASHVVYEFPELQGIMGAHYAQKEGLSTEISQAIFQHWLPRFDEDVLPSSSLGILLSLADKIDNLLSCFLTQKIPSSSSDPYALRRQSLGIIRILIDQKIFISLPTIFKECLAHFTLDSPSLLPSALLTFIQSRMKTVFKQFNLAPDEIQAVLNLGDLDIYDLYLRATSLQKFRHTSNFLPLMEVFKRAKGQLHTQILVKVNPALFKVPEEKNLYKHLQTIESQFELHMKNHRYNEAFHLLATLQLHLKPLFEKVQILVDEEAIRLNRLALLNNVLRLFKSLIDFNELNIS